MTEKLQALSEQLKQECERLKMTNIIIYDVQGISPLTDVVLIATAEHVLQLEAARRSLSLIAKQSNYKLQNPTEDYSEGWLAMDFSDLMAHIFIPEKRSFYDLDALMSSIGTQDYSKEDPTQKAELPISAKQLREHKAVDILRENEL